MKLSREFRIDPRTAGLLVVDVQKYVFELVKTAAKASRSSEPEVDEQSFLRHLNDTTIPNISGLVEESRAASIEIIYTVIESLTEDGRDRSLDYKISGLHVPRGSDAGQVIESVAPKEDEIVIRKTSSNSFVSTNIDYVLRNLGVKDLVVCGLFTDQCVESAVRSACDLGYRVCLVEDACLSYNIAAHHRSLQNMRGYCTQRTTGSLISEFKAKIAV